MEARIQQSNFKSKGNSRLDKMKKENTIEERYNGENYKGSPYPNRNEYLRSLSEEFAINYGKLRSKANELGEEEDFGDLILWCEKYSGSLDEDY